VCWLFLLVSTPELLSDNGTQAATGGGEQDLAPIDSHCRCDSSQPRAVHRLISPLKFSLKAIQSVERSAHIAHPDGASDPDRRTELSLLVVPIPNFSTICCVNAQQTAL
jgi:hypothetical protein